MDFVEFSFWLDREMRAKEIPGSASIQFIDLRFTDIDTREIVIDYDRESNSVQIRNIKPEW